MFCGPRPTAHWRVRLTTPSLTALGRTYNQAAGVLRNSPPFVWFGPNPEAFGHHGVGGSIGVGDLQTRMGISYATNKLYARLDNGPRAGGVIAAAYEALGVRAPTVVHTGRGG
jgi:CubicO group peptidase (beta-lactamase class C family)